MVSKKRKIALVLALVMMISIIPIQVFAGDSDEINYNVQKPAVGVMNIVKKMICSEELICARQMIISTLYINLQELRKTMFPVQAAY